LKSSDGALVQDVTAGSPGARAGLRTYDLIVAVDGKPIDGNDALITLIAARTPGSTATLQIVRDGRALNVPVKLAERPQRDRRLAGTDPQRPLPSSQRGTLLGLSVRDVDDESAARLRLPHGTTGVIVSRVEPMSPAFDAEIERGHVLLEINRQPVRSIEDYRRLTGDVRSGDVLTVYLYRPELDQRTLQTIKVD
jgi:serine protease Do